MRAACHQGMALIAALLLTSCATVKPAMQPSGIGPYTDISGRLLVIQSDKRWQVELDWHGTPDAGHARLTHAASNRIVELEWSGKNIRIRDNRQETAWRQISARQLEERGIIMPPRQIAQLLAGQLPASFKERSPSHWEGNLHGSHLRITWAADSRRLTILDISHGNKLVLLIQP